MKELIGYHVKHHDDVWIIEIEGSHTGLGNIYTASTLEDVMLMMKEDYPYAIEIVPVDYVL